MSGEERTLYLPLHQLTPRTARDDLLVGGTASWAERVSEAQETALLLNERGRVVAMSTGAALALNLDVSTALGKSLLDLVVVVDFSETGVPVDDPDVQLPPLKALRSQTMARGLVRLRLGRGILTTYDCVGVPLAGGDGALAFFAEV
ncbi:MAG TPA: hypothetical protein VM097_00600 [Mycobacteriales bacterium]|nr:hypothetical protein [Mycobacteriales bacterium]